MREGTKVDDDPVEMDVRDLRTSYSYKRGTDNRLEIMCRNAKPKKNTL